MRYKYTGINRDRKNVTGIVEAENEMEADLCFGNMQARPKSLLIQKDGIFVDRAGKRKELNIPGVSSRQSKGSYCFHSPVFESHRCRCSRRPYGVMGGGYDATNAILYPASPNVPLFAFQF